ncbi:uncharacterized protein [Porites lutea]|uniref:uncharacterized protein n=1 Tax=Porites lutea TaxID=51062 RepID=UPI003CC510A5
MYYTLEERGISSAIKLSITCISFLTLFVDGNLVGEDKSTFYNSWVTSKDIAVVGFLLLKTKVTSKIQCGLKCSQHKICASFSMQYTRRPGKRICELNTVSAKSHHQGIVKRICFQYY